MLSINRIRGDGRRGEEYSLFSDLNVILGLVDVFDVAGQVTLEFVFCVDEDEAIISDFVGEISH